MDISGVLGLFGQYGPVVGPVVAVLGFYLWRDYRREMRLQSRVEALEKEQKEVLLPMVEQCVKVIAQNTVVMQRLERVIERCSAATRHEQRSVLDKLIEDARD